MKKIVSIMLVAAMMVAVLAGCGSSPSAYTPNYGGSAQQRPPVTLPQPQPAWPDETDPVQVETQPQQTEPVSNVLQSDNGQLHYVMIYNPDIYDENTAATQGKLSTGSIGAQIDVNAFRNDGPATEPETPFISVSQTELNSNIPFGEINLEGGRGGSTIIPYEVGDTRSFYRFQKLGLNMPRQLETFTCRYAGTYCNIWTNDNTMNEAAVSYYGNEFDTKVYQQTVDAFGTARFADNGGKVNLLFYGMQDGLAGCFYTGDIFASDELTAVQAAQYAFNTDHAILHINANYAIYQNLADMMSGTMAHEFQHLICATDLFYTYMGVYCNTWLNEAMSGFIEEQLYPGTKNTSGHYESLAGSDGIRHGQSMYNFSTTADDIGVYGSVYLFSEYLKSNTNANVFYDLHDYWRTSFSNTINDAEALRNAVGNSFANKIDNVIRYPSSIRFANEDQEWMSKLILDFYLSSLTKEAGEPQAYANVNPQSLIYDEINAAQIEGGGRIIVAVKGDNFEIPADADGGLVYIGLDQNFQPITDFVVS